MKTLFLDCGMGAAGDMLAAALLELTGKPEEILQTLNHIGLPGVVFSAAPSEKRGVRGTRFTVTVHGEEEHADGGQPQHAHTHTARGLTDIVGIIERLRVPEAVKVNAAAVYRVIAQAEGQVHGASVDQVHFHEVGALDAVADITAFCLLMEHLKPERVCASPVATGFGQVRCAHGLLPVPAPATALILQGIPSYSGGIEGELCTPTGAALLKHFAQKFERQPVMAVSQMGYGMGKKDFERVNCVRAFWGETPEADEMDTVTEISCNLDDMTPEALAFAQQLLLDEGALDVTVTPTVMKKGRAGVVFSCLCAVNQTDCFTALVFRHTTTLGVRVSETSRRVLRRNIRRVETPYGAVNIKEAEGYGVKKRKPEYKDIAAAARASGKALSEIENELYRYFE